MWISKRDTEILETLVTLYGTTRSPVSSAQLSDHLAYSCSLIRKELQKMESYGLLKKENRSAGRTPTDKGLKAYLRTLEGNGNGPADAVKSEINASGKNFSELSTRSALLLARESDTIGFVCFDSIFDLEFSRIKLIKIDSYKIMLILNTRNQWVFSKIFTTRRNHPDSELNSWEDILNTEFSDRTLNRVFRIIRNRLYKDKERYINVYRGIYHLFGTENLTTADLFYNGALNLLNSSGTDPETLRRIIETLDEKERFSRFLRDILNDRNPNPVIAFGKESGISGFDELVLITSNVYCSENPIGKLGIIGPKFTRYSETINRVRNFSSSLSAIISDNSLEA